MKNVHIIGYKTQGFLIKFHTAYLVKLLFLAKLIFVLTSCLSHESFPPLLPPTFLPFFVNQTYFFTFALAYQLLLNSSTINSVSHCSLILSSSCPPYFYKSPITIYQNDTYATNLDPK